MKCKQYYEIISAYVDSEATPLEQTALMKHMVCCKACKTELSSQFMLKNIFSQCRIPASDVDVCKNVMQAVLKKNSSLIKKEKRTLLKKIATKRVFSATFTVAAILITIFSISLKEEQDSRPELFTEYVYSHVKTVSDTIQKNKRNKDFIQVSFR